MGSDQHYLSKKNMLTWTAESSGEEKNTGWFLEGNKRAEDTAKKAVRP